LKSAFNILLNKFFSLSPLKGNVPTANLYIKTPNDHMSAYLP